jgi:hypothetical protein
VRAGTARHGNGRGEIERRDPDFAEKMAAVLCVYRQVQILKQEAATKEEPSEAVAIISYDEKPGIQAIATTAPDLPPEPGIALYLYGSFTTAQLGTITESGGTIYLDGTLTNTGATLNVGPGTALSQLVLAGSHMVVLLAREWIAGSTTRTGSNAACSRRGYWLPELFDAVDAIRRRSHPACRPGTPGPSPRRPPCRRRWCRPPLVPRA